MNCQLCGSHAPTKHVTFYQNIGALVIRFHRKLEGDLCKSCIHKNFWKMTLITLTVGWLGVISLIMAPIFIMLNVAHYLLSLGLPSAYPAGAQTMDTPAASTPPPPPAPAVETLENQTVEALNPHAEQIATRLNAGENTNAVAADLARTAGVSSSQAVLYIHALIEASQQAS